MKAHCHHMAAITIRQCDTSTSTAAIKGDVHVRLDSPTATGWTRLSNLAIKHNYPATRFIESIITARKPMQWSIECWPPIKMPLKNLHRKSSLIGHGFLRVSPNRKFNVSGAFQPRIQTSLSICSPNLPNQSQSARIWAVLDPLLTGLKQPSNTNKNTFIIIGYLFFFRVAY